MKKLFFYPFKMIFILIFGISCSNNGKVEKVFTRTDYIEGGKNHPIYHFGEVNKWLAERGGDTSYSLFMVPERLALMPRPQILIFNQDGEMLEEICAAHFSSSEHLKKSLEQRGNSKKWRSDNLFDLLETQFINGEEVLHRLPKDVDRYILIPWGKGDTIADSYTGITPYEDWIKPVIRVAEDSDMHMTLIWEAIAFTDLHDMTRDEFSNLRFEAMRERFPKNFKEDHEIENPKQKRID